MGKKAKCGVYKITNIKNGLIYIGSSRNIEKRWRNHIWSLNNNRHHNFFMQRDWNNYGSKFFKFEILELCDEKNQFDLEQTYLDSLLPYHKLDNGYNLSENASIIGIKPMLRYLNYDYFKYPHYVKEIGVPYRMPITDEDYLYKSKEELQDEYDGYITMKYLESDMIMCDPDYE